MFSTPLICSSIGATTVEATTSALAPGYWPATLMIGGAISGYWATGRRKKATPPRIRNTIESTEAKIGRSMKKCEIRIDRLSLGFRLRGIRRRRGILLLRRDLDPGTRLHQAVDDDAVVRGEALLDDPQVIDELAQRHIFLHRLVVGIDGEHVFARLLGGDGDIGDEQRRIGRRARHAHAREHAGGERALGIREHRPAADGARRAVDDVVDEIHVAAVDEVVLVDESQG